MRSEVGVARLRGVLTRRAGWVGTVAAVTLLAGGALVASLRPVYRAQVVLRMLESQPAKEYVAPTVAEPYGERLRTLRVAVMARPLLVAVAEELKLPEALGVSREEVVEAMRARMEVKVEGDDTFLLTYEDADPARARAVAAGVAQRFVARGLEQRAAAAAATRHALEEELARLRPELLRREAAVDELKRARYGTLPEQQEENLRTLDQTTMEINIQATNLDTAEERRRQLLLGVASSLRAQEAQLTTALHEARTRYTSEHPEVRRIEAELGRVQRQRAAEESALRRGQGADPEVASLDREIGRGRALLGALRTRQREVRERLRATAQTASQLAPLLTDLEVVRGRYQAAIGKLHEAALAQDVERALRDQRWDLVEQAPPLRPVRPDRALWALGSLLLAAAAGLGAGLLRDLSDRSIHTPEELVAAAQEGEMGRPLEVLACVPRIDTAERRAASGRSRSGR